MERNTKFHKTADTITVKLKFLLFSAIIAFLFPLNASAYVVKYKEDYYKCVCGYNYVVDLVVSEQSSGLA